MLVSTLLKGFAVQGDVELTLYGGYGEVLDTLRVEKCEDLSGVPAVRGWYDRHISQIFSRNNILHIDCEEEE